MPKFPTMLFTAIAALVACTPAMATQETGTPVSALQTMAVGNPHPTPQPPVNADARIEARRNLELSEWQKLLGGNQPFPAMGVGGHPR